MAGNKNNIEIKITEGQQVNGNSDLSSQKIGDIIKKIGKKIELIEADISSLSSQVKIDKREAVRQRQATYEKEVESLASPKERGKKREVPSGSAGDELLKKERELNKVKAYTGKEAKEVRAALALLRKYAKELTILNEQAKALEAEAEKGEDTSSRNKELVQSIVAVQQKYESVMASLERANIKIRSPRKKTRSSSQKTSANRDPRSKENKTPTKEERASVQYRMATKKVSELEKQREQLQADIERTQTNLNSSLRDLQKKRKEIEKQIKRLRGDGGDGSLIKKAQAELEKINKQIAQETEKYSKTQEEYERRLAEIEGQNGALQRIREEQDRARQRLREIRQSSSSERARQVAERKSRTEPRASAQKRDAALLLRKREEAALARERARIPQVSVADVPDEVSVRAAAHLAKTDSVEAKKRLKKALEEQAREAARREKLITPEEFRTTTPPRSVMPLSVRLNKEYDPKTGKYNHHYEYLDENGNVSPELMETYGAPMTVTQVQTILFNEQLKNLDSDLEILRAAKARGAFQAQIRGKNVHVQSELEKLEKYKENLIKSQKYGTVFHQIAEDIGKRKYKAEDAASIVRRVQELAMEEDKMGVPQESRVYGNFVRFTGEGRDRQAIIDAKFAEKLIPQIKKYQTLIDENGLGDLVGEEIPLAGLFNLGERAMVLAGTLDQLFLNENGEFGLGDIKTSSSLTPGYAFQLDALSRLLAANSIQIGRGKRVITSINRNTGHGSTVHAEPINDENFFELLRLANILSNESTSEKELATARESAQKIFNTLSLTRDVKQGDRGLGYGDFPNLFSVLQGAKTKEEQVKRFLDFYYSLSPDAQQTLMRQLYSTKKYIPEQRDDKGKIIKNAYSVETKDELYRRGTQRTKYQTIYWDAIREALPTPMQQAIEGNSNTRFFELSTGSFKDEETGKQIQGTTLGGMYLSEWIRAANLAAKQAEDAARKENKSISDQEIQKIRRDAIQRVVRGMLIPLEQAVLTRDNGATSEEELDKARMAISFIDSAIRRGYEEQEAWVGEGEDRHKEDVEVIPGGKDFADVLSSLIEPPEGRISEFHSIAAEMQKRDLQSLGGNIMDTDRETREQNEAVSGQRFSVPIGQENLAEDVLKLLKEVDSYRALYEKTKRNPNDKKALEEYERKRKEIYQKIYDFGNIYRQAYLGAGKEVEFSGQGKPTEINNADIILDILEKAYKEILSKMPSPEETDDYEKVGSAFYPEGNGENLQVAVTQIGHRLNRMIAASAYYERAFAEDVKLLQTQAAERGYGYVSTEEAMHLLLTPEQYKQYVESKNIASLWEKYKKESTYDPKNPDKDLRKPFYDFLRSAFGINFERPMKKARRKITPGQSLGEEEDEIEDEELSAIRAGMSLYDGVLPFGHSEEWTSLSKQISSSLGSFSSPESFYDTITGTLSKVGGEDYKEEFATLDNQHRARALLRGQTLDNTLYGRGSDSVLSPIGADEALDRVDSIEQELDAELSVQRAQGAIATWEKRRESGEVSEEVAKEQIELQKRIIESARKNAEKKKKALDVYKKYIGHSKFLSGHRDKSYLDSIGINKEDFRKLFVFYNENRRVFSDADRQRAESLSAGWLEQGFSSPEEKLLHDSKILNKSPENDAKRKEYEKAIKTLKLDRVFRESGLGDVETRLSQQEEGRKFLRHLKGYVTTYDVLQRNKIDLEEMKELSRRRPIASNERKIAELAKNISTNRRYPFGVPTEHPFEDMASSGALSGFNTDGTPILLLPAPASSSAPTTGWKKAARGKYPSKGRLVRLSEQQNFVSQEEEKASVPEVISSKRRKKSSVPREWDFDETRGDFFYKKKDGSFGGQKVSRKLLSEDQLGRVGKIAPPAGGSGGGAGGTISGGNVTISGGNITVKGSPVKVYGKPVEVRSSTETNVDAKGDTTINVSGPVTMNDAGGGSPTTISLTGNVQILGFGAKVTGGEGERSSKRSKPKAEKPSESSSEVRVDSSASTTAPDASASGTEGEKNNSISSIGKLIRELDQLERSIQKFNFRIDNAEGRGTDEDQEIADRLKGARADLEARRDAVMAEYEAEYSGLTTEAQGKADKLFADSKARRDASAESVRLTESTKAEEDQLKRYERLLQERLQIEQKITSNLQKRATSQNRNEIEHLDNALSLEQQRLATLTAEGDQIRKNLKASGRGAAVDAADMAYAERSEMLKAETATNMHGARNIWDILGYDIQRSFNMIFDYGLAYRAISGIRTAFQGVLQDINEFDKAITNLRIVTGDTKEETEDLMRSYNKMADQLGVTTSAIADASNEWLRQGYSIDETNDLIEASIQLSKLGGTTAADATEKLTAVLKGFKMEASEVGDIVDKLVSLDMDFATTASNIGEALSRVSAVARQAGMDLNETAAAVTVVMDATQADAGSVGTAFRTIMTRYMNVKAGQFTDLETGEADKTLNDTEKVLKTLGISIRDSKMEFRDFSDVLDELADKWITLSSVEKSAVAVSLAGTRQQNMFFNLMDNYDKYQEAIETSADSAGTAEEKYEAYSESIEYQVERLTAAWEGFAQKLKANPVIVWLTEQAANLVEYLPNIIRMFVTLFTTINAYKIPTAFKNFFGMFTTPGKYGGKGTASIFTGAGQAQRAAKKQGEWNQQHGIASDVDRPFQTLESVSMQGNKIAQEGNQKLGFIQTAVAKIANKVGLKTTTAESTAFASTVPDSALTTSAFTVGSHRQPLTDMRRYARSLYRSSAAFSPLDKISIFDDDSYMGSKTAFWAKTRKEKKGRLYNWVRDRASDIQTDKSDMWKESQIAKEALEYYTTGKIRNPQFKNVTDVHMTPSGRWSFKDANGKRRYSRQKPMTEEDFVQQNYYPYIDVFEEQDRQNILRGKYIYKGKKYKFDRKAQQFKGAKDDSTPDKETQEALATAQKNKAAIKKQKLIGAASTGLMSGFSTAMTTEGSAGDKAIAGVLSGGLSAIGTAFAGPIGGIIGQVVGDLLGSVLLTIIHQDEIARQERVENSKAYLEALQGLSSTMEEVGDNITKGLENWTAKDYEAQQEYVKEIKSTLYAIDDKTTENVDEAENSKELREAFAEELQKLPGEIQKLITGDSEKVSSSYSDISSALDILASGGEGAEEINAALMAAQYRQQAQALWGSQEEERYQAIQTMSDSRVAHEVISALEEFEKSDEYKALTEKEKEEYYKKANLYNISFGDKANDYEGAQATLDQLDEEVAQNNMMSAFYSSGVSQMSSLDIGEASLAGTRLKILKDWAEIDKTIVNQDGTFTQDAIDMVNDFLRTQENFSSLFESANLTFGEVFDTGNEKKRDAVVEALRSAGYSVSNFQDVLDLASKNTEESSKAMEEAAKVLETTAEEVVDDLFNLDASNIQSFAAAFGTSSEFIEKNLGALQNLKLEDIINGLDGLNSRYEDIASIFDDIASDLTISQSNLDKIMEKYSFLMYGEDEEGNVTFSQGNILQNIVDMVVGKGSEASLAYSSGIINEANNSADAFEALRKKYKGNWSALFGEDLTEEELQILNSEDATMSLVMSSSLFSKMGDAVYEEWGKIVSQLVGESEYMSMLQESIYEYGSYLAQKEIDNLESIKDNLDAINETRQKELDLIKAKDKLENAKNEKQLVYRAGIGWTYQSDQTAVREAKEELDNLETEQQQDDIQYLIDQLTKAQDRLEGADTEEQLRGFKEAFESWSTAVEEDIGKIDTKSIVSAIDSMLKWFQSDLPLLFVQGQVEDMTKDEMANGKNEGLISQAKNVASAYSNLKAAEAQIDNTAENSIDRALAVKNYNELLEDYNTAVNTAKGAGLTAENLNSIINDSANGITISNGSLNDLSSLYGGESFAEKKNKPQTFRYVLNGNFYNEKNLNDPSGTYYAHATFTNEPWEEDKYKWFYDKKDLTWILPYPYTGDWIQMSRIAPLTDSPEDLVSLLSSYGDYTVVASMNGGDEFGYLYNGILYKIRDSRGWDKFSGNTGAGFKNYANGVGVSMSWNGFGGAKADGDLSGYNAANNEAWINEGSYTNVADQNYINAHPSADSNASGTKSFRGGLSYVNEAGLEGIITPQGTLTALPSKTGIVPADLTSNLYHLAEVAPNLIKTLDSASIRYPESGSTTNTTDNSTNVQNLYASFQATEDFDFDKFLVDVRGVINNTRHTA